MKGIIIAGGNGTRLSPLTQVISKSLLPVFNKPMIYYPLSILIQAGITEILIITTPQDKWRYVDLLGDGSKLGISLQYEIEPSPKGIGQAFLIGKDFIDGDSVTLILGDNFFYGEGLTRLLKEAGKRRTGATIFGCPVKDPRRFGVVSFNKNGEVTSIEEKPVEPKSNYAVAGLYVYDYRVVEFAKLTKPSKRGELEITDINNSYLKLGELYVERLEDGYTWMDMGTHQSLFEAANFINEIEKTQNVKIACLEEIAYKKGYITKEQLFTLTKPLLKSDYGEYLMKIIQTDLSSRKNRKNEN